MDISQLTAILDLDVDAMVVTVEGAVVLADLVTATLQRNCVPQVVPEFPTFSVSGLGPIDLPPQLRFTHLRRPSCHCH